MGQWISTCNWVHPDNASAYCTMHSNRTDYAHTDEMMEWIEGSAVDVLDYDDKGITNIRTGLHFDYEEQVWKDPVLERIKRAHRRALANLPRSAQNSDPDDRSRTTFS